MTIVSNLEDIKDIGKKLISDGISAIKKANDTFWASPYGSHSKKALSTIAEAAKSREIGKAIETIGNVGKYAGKIGDGLQLTLGAYQLAAGDNKAAAETGGDIVGGIGGGALGGLAAVGILALTGVGAIPAAIITVICVGGGSFGGSAVGKNVAGEIYDRVK